MRYSGKCFVTPKQDWQKSTRKNYFEEIHRTTVFLPRSWTTPWRSVPQCPITIQGKPLKKSSIFSSDREVKIMFKQNLWTWLQELTGKSNNTQCHVNDIAVLKAVESFKFLFHRLAQGGQVTFTVLVFVLLNPSDGDLTVP